MIFCICGGDLRMAELANFAAAEGHEVRVAGFDSPAYFQSGVALYPCPEDGLAGCDAACLPLPVSRDDLHLFAPFSHRPYPLDRMLPLLAGKKLVCGGKISGNLQKKAADQGIFIADYLLREDFAVANAVPTAEGALQIAMEQLRSTLNQASCLILGYGRVGMVLASRLRGMNASVTVCCRNGGALALARAMGNAALPLAALSDAIGRFSLILNTIPHRILTPELLQKVAKDALILELASSPGGADPAYCRKIGIKLLAAQRLPGKVAPVTGGQILYETILAMMQDEGREATP